MEHITEKELQQLKETFGRSELVQKAIEEIRRLRDKVRLWRKFDEKVVACFIDESSFGKRVVDLGDNTITFCEYSEIMTETGLLNDWEEGIGKN